MNSFKILISMLVVIYLLPGVFGNAVPSLNFPNDDPCFCDVFNQNPYFVSQIEETFKMSNRIRRFEITPMNPHESSECKILVYVKNKMRFFSLYFDKYDCGILSFSKIYTETNHSSEELIFTFDHDTWYPWSQCWFGKGLRIKQNCIDAQKAADARNKILELRRNLLQAQKRAAEAILAVAIYVSTVVVLVSILLFFYLQIYQMYQEHQQQAIREQDHQQQAGQEHQQQAIPELEHQQQAGPEQEHQQQAGQEQEHQQQAGPDQEQQDQGNPGGQAIPDDHIYFG